jgi:hypothetical protein
MEPPNRAGGRVDTVAAGVALEADTALADTEAWADGGRLLQAATRLATGIIRVTQHRIVFSP